MSNIPLSMQPSENQARAAREAQSLPPGVNAAISSTRSVWSAKDEAALQELLNRKQRIMGEHMEHLADVLDGVDRHDTDERFLRDIIALAEALRDALAPFDGRKP